MAEAKHLMFVYGTLKVGQPNHHYLTTLGKGFYKLIGRAVTVSKYPLVIAGSNNVPFCLNVEGQGHNVYGELYEVDDTMLSSLDRLEKHPHWYRREIIPVNILNEDGDKIRIEQSWIYLFPGFKEFMLHLENHESYDSEGDHKLPYLHIVQRKPIDNERMIAELKADKADLQAMFKEGSYVTESKTLESFLERWSIS